MVENFDPRGRRYYWIGGTDYQFEREEGTDCTAVYEHGDISITPVNLDLTDRPSLDALGRWSVDGFQRRE